MKSLNSWLNDLMTNLNSLNLIYDIVYDVENVLETFHETCIGKKY